MRVEAYVIAHYGREYLTYAIRGMYDNVQRIHLVYTNHPSHGSTTTLPCPDSRQDLLDAAFAYDPQRKVSWVDVTQFYEEGKHRDYALSLCDEADLALVVDCDEIWDPEVLERALRLAYDSQARVWRINFTSPWRSFNWVCRDSLWPDRIHNFRSPTKDYGYVPTDLGEIYHFGYAVRNEIMVYKAAIHGHVGEWRKDWFETKWSIWPPPPDCHPTNERGFWNPEPFDKNQLPDFMKEHPYFHLERIE